MTTSIRSDVTSPLDIRTERVYGATAAARLSGISYRQLDHWERMGVLTPSVQEAKGSGTSRQYSTGDILVLAVLGELAKLGAKLVNLAAAKPLIRKALQDEYRWLIVTPQSFVEVCDNNAVTVVLEMHNLAGAWVVDVSAVAARIQSAATEEPIQL